MLLAPGSLYRASYDVLKNNKKFLLFPLLAGISWLCIAIVALPKVGANYSEYNRLTSFLLFYFGCFLTANFFTTGLIACAMAQLRGENTSLWYGLMQACAKIPQILGWALIEATIGVILRRIEDSKGLGVLLAQFLGMMFTLAGIFVIPIIIVENKDPISAFMASQKEVRKVWGSRGRINYGFNGFLLLIAFVWLFYIATKISPHEYLPTILTIEGICLASAMLFCSTLTSITIAALYLYCTNTLQGQYDRECLRSAVKE